MLVDNLREHLSEYFMITVAIAAVILVVVMAFKPTAIQRVETHNMENGVTCYTFDRSIDCLKIELFDLEK